MRLIDQVESSRKIWQNLVVIRSWHVTITCERTCFTDVMKSIPWRFIGFSNRIKLLQLLSCIDGHFGCRQIYERENDFRSLHTSKVALPFQTMVEETFGLGERFGLPLHAFLKQEITNSNDVSIFLVFQTSLLIKTVCCNGCNSKWNHQTHNGQDLGNESS